MNAVRWIRLGFICLAAWMMLFAGFARAERLSLDECIEIALNRNVSLASAHYSLDLARQNVWSAYGSWTPQFSLSASYTYYEQGGVSQYQFTSPISRTYSKSINVQQSLFRWGGNYFNL